MPTFLTADTHFGHAGIISPRMTRPRPFDSIEHHDEVLIQRWNAVVGPDDEVWHLGDFAMDCTSAYSRKCFDRLNGVKRLVHGNHERIGKRLPWASQHEALVQILIEGQRTVLLHYALRAWPGIWRGALHLFGHTHGSLPGTRRSTDVGVDCWDFRPVGMNEILGRMAETATWPEELITTPSAD